MRKLWAASKDYLPLEASRAHARACRELIEPNPDLQSDAPNLIASMLAAGYDRDAARWAAAVRQMDDQVCGPRPGRCSRLALRTARAIDLGVRRINAFIDRDKSEGKKRSALLVAGLAGLGRIDQETAARLSSRFEPARSSTVRRGPR